MVQVVLYAKPGCQGNARQMRVLQSAGHDVVVRDLLTEPWTAATLRSFFGSRPVSEWINRSAVRVKSGEIVPESLTADEAMALLIADPALIRRPLLEATGQRHAGWDPELIAHWIGLATEMSPGKEGCASRAGNGDAPMQPLPAGNDACHLTAEDR